MKVNRVDHIGIAVKSIQDSLKLYRDTLGLDLKGIENIEERKLRTAFLEVGESKFELLEPTDDSSTIQKHIEKRGEGIQHIAINFDNIEEAMDELRENGYRLLSDKPQPGAGGTRVAFLHPKSSKGVLLELVEGSH